MGSLRAAVATFEEREPVSGTRRAHAAVLPSPAIGDDLAGALLAACDEPPPTKRAIAFPTLRARRR